MAVELACYPFFFQGRWFVLRELLPGVAFPVQSGQKNLEVILSSLGEVVAVLMCP